MLLSSSSSSTSACYYMLIITILPHCHLTKFHASYHLFSLTWTWTWTWTLSCYHFSLVTVQVTVRLSSEYCTNYKDNLMAIPDKKTNESDQTKTSRRHRLCGVYQLFASIGRCCRYHYYVLPTVGNDKPDQRPKQEELLVPEESSIGLPLNLREVIALLCVKLDVPYPLLSLNQVSLPEGCMSKLDCPTTSHHHNWNKELLCCAVLKGPASRSSHSNQDS